MSATLSCPLRYPVLISGPFVSSITAHVILVFFIASFKLSSVFLCDAWVPCEKLNRATFIPLVSISQRSSTESQEGLGLRAEAYPSVQTTLVLCAVISGGAKACLKYVFASSSTPVIMLEMLI